MNDMILADRIKNLREKHKLTQKEFAESLGVTQSALSKIERGVQMPSADTLIALREVYKINLNRLLVQ